jgi:hypothetical protein
MTTDRMTLIIPPFTMDWYPEGVDCTDAADADLFLIDHGTWEDRVIEEAQEILLLTEPDLKGFTWCAHNAIARGSNAAGLKMLSEMGPSGFERRPIYEYKHHVYARVHFLVGDELRGNAVKYDEACENLDYGWSQYLFDGLDDITGIKLACSLGDALICSTEATLVMMGLGLFPDRPPSLIVPARTALWFNAKPVTIGPAEQLILHPEDPQDNK